jgi:hypothetical protein
MPPGMAGIRRSDMSENHAWTSGFRWQLATAAATNGMVLFHFVATWPGHYIPIFNSHRVIGAIIAESECKEL